MDLQEMIQRRLGQGRAGQPPEARLVVGPIGVGKTTYRMTHLSEGYVHIDSADIFHELSAGNATLDFPDHFAAQIEHAGRAITRAALAGRLNIVLESPGHEAAPMIRLIDALKRIGYHVEVIGLTADREVCEARHAGRGDSVSSYWAGPIHVGWVVDECEALAST